MPNIDLFQGEYAFLETIYPHVEIAEHLHGYPTVENYLAAMHLPKGHPAREDFKGFAPLIAMRRVHKMGTNKWRRDWSKTLEYEILVYANGQKFKVPELRAKLLATWPGAIIHGNMHHDNHFGRCFCDRCKGRVRSSNKLGEALMAVRTSISDGDD